MEDSINLQRFAETGTAASGETAAAAAGQQATGESQQAADAGRQEGPGATAPKSRAQAFEELITGEYKDEFASRVQGILSKRLAKTKTAEQTLSADTQRQRQAAAQAQHAQALARLAGQVRQAQQAYPGMELRAELQNPAFRGMLRAGVPVKTAYEAAHSDQLLAGAMRYTAQTVAEKLAQSMQGAAPRVQENGTASTGAAEPRPNPARLSRDQRRALIERARAGEKITF